MEKGNEKYDLSYTQNRELSWLQFNLRVLEEAENDELPLLERLRFVSIFTSNLDEFFMVRVGSLVDLAVMEPNGRDNKSGKTPSEQLTLIYKAIGPMLLRRDSAYEKIMKELDEQGVSEAVYSKLKGKEEKFAEKYFIDNIRPLLSPQIIDSSHPFPHLKNKALYIAILLKHGEKQLLGLVDVPENMPKIVYIPSEKGIRFIRIEEIILGNISKIFMIYQPLEKTVISVTRNADISLDDEKFDEDNPDYCARMTKLLKQRGKLAPVRLEVMGKAHELGRLLAKKLGLGKEQTYYFKCPPIVSWAYSLAADRKDLLNAPFEPKWPAYLSEVTPMKEQIKSRDILLFYPYHSMQPFLNMLKEASRDKDVISISITLYRLANSSQVAKYLSEAAENGKNVTVLVELRARFDEENNIGWAKFLEEAGCRVLYGLDGFKCHSKICLITRRTKSGVSYITQIGTGNYNEKTAALYTDFSLMTADKEIGANAANFFSNMLIGNLYESYSKLIVAPRNMKDTLIRLIDNEIARGPSGRIIIKTNSVTERAIIDKLCEASCAGVRIDLIVRGICCILPEVPEKTENIRVTSIVGRFLEHSRIYAFGTGEHRRIYISSADIMTRNQERRVEIACPVTSAEHKRWFNNYLELLLIDNIKARRLTSFGAYVKKSEQPSGKIDAQKYFIDHELTFEKTQVKRKSIMRYMLDRICK